MKLLLLLLVVVIVVVAISIAPINETSQLTINSQTVSGAYIYLSGRGNQAFIWVY